MRGEAVMLSLLCVPLSRYPVPTWTSSQGWRVHYIYVQWQRHHMTARGRCARLPILHIQRFAHSLMLELLLHGTALLLVIYRTFGEKVCDTPEHAQLIGS